MLFPTFQLSGDRFPQEVGKAFALFAGGLDALKGALGKACQRLFVVDLFSAHGRNIDAITYCYKPLFCCYHLFTTPELLLSSIHQQREQNMAKIEFLDGVYLLHIPGREAPMGFFTRESAVSFAVNNLCLTVEA